jgi:N-acetylglucosamine kinase-like BadF-type ATPase
MKLSSRLGSSQGYCALGIDGGGTKTHAVIVDSEGNAIATATTGSANGFYAGQDVAASSVYDAIMAVAGQIDQPQSIVAVAECLMGGWTGAKRALEEIGFSGKAYRCGEGEIAFRAANILHGRGIAIIAGTGSGTRYIEDGKAACCTGGWGVGVGDEGSASDIGLNAIRAVGRAYEGRGPETIIKDMLFEGITHKEPFIEVLRTYWRPVPRQRELGSIAILVHQAAMQGDAVAIEILADAGRSLGQDAVCMAQKYYKPEDEVDVVYSGGVFRAGEFVMGPLEAVVRAQFPRSRFHKPVLSTGEAAARIALENYLCK